MYTDYNYDCSNSNVCINFNHCIVDGGWSSWEYGSCSNSCGGGTQTLTRTCDNPTPSCGGNDCSGPSVDQSECNNDCCPSKTII